MVECARLEIWFTVHRNVGSNPTLSTIQGVPASLRTSLNPLGNRQGPCPGRFLPYPEISAFVVGRGVGMEPSRFKDGFKADGACGRCGHAAKFSW